MKNNRSLTTLLRQPKQQLTLSILLSAMMSIIFAAFVMINLNILQSTIISMAKENQVQPSWIEELNRQFAVMAAVTGVFALLSIFAGILIGLTMTTRLFGPVVPLRKLIASFAQGDYKARAHLRKNDELQDLMHDLNALGAKLDERKSQAN